MDIIYIFGILVLQLLQALSIEGVELNSTIDQHQFILNMKGQLTSMSTNLDRLIKKVNTEENSILKIFNLEIQENQNTGTFNKPTDRKELLNKLYELKNEITKLINDMTTHTDDVASIKVRIYTLEKELEKLTKQLDNEGRDVKEELKDFANTLSNLTQSINDYYKKQKQKEIDEFLKAIKNKYYDYAAFKLSLINDENIINNLILAAYKYVNLNVDNLIEFIKFIKVPEQRYLVYRTLYTYIKSNEKEPFSEICRKYSKLITAYNEDKVNKMIHPELNDQQFFSEAEANEFFEAFEKKYYECAGSILTAINDDNKVENLTITAYKNVNLDISVILDVVKFISVPHNRYMACKSLYTYIEGVEAKPFFNNAGLKLATLSSQIYGDKLFRHFYPPNMPELNDKSDPFNKFFFRAGIVY